MGVEGEGKGMGVCGGSGGEVDPGGEFGLGPSVGVGCVQEEAVDS